ncbi:MAG: hypothetical protein HC902_06520 [Calothrix sp. SM1_5_4]|nr:hypothetical protein [Calothrix sp. SM1_5_4]
MINAKRAKYGRALSALTLVSAVLLLPEPGRAQKDAWVKLSTIDLSGQRLEFFPELRDALVAVAENSEPAPAREPTIPEKPACSSQDMADDAICGFSYDEKRILSRTRTICAEIREPLNFYRNMPVPEAPDSAMMATEEGVLRATFALAAKVEWPAGLANSRWLRSLESALFKINKLNFASRLDARMRVLRRCQSQPAKDAYYELVLLAKQSGVLSGRNAEKLTAAERETLSAATGAMLWRLRGGGGYFPELVPGDSKPTNAAGSSSAGDLKSWRNGAATRGRSMNTWRMAFGFHCSEAGGSITTWVDFTTTFFRTSGE